jgi:hypothetical protein
MSPPLRRQERLSKQPGRSYLLKDLCGKNGIIAIPVQLMRAAFSQLAQLQFASNNSPTVSDRLWDSWRAVPFLGTKRLQRTGWRAIDLGIELRSQLVHDSPEKTRLSFPLGGVAKVGFRRGQWVRPAGLFCFPHQETASWSTLPI